MANEQAKAIHTLIHMQGLDRKQNFVNNFFVLLYIAKILL